MPWQVTVNADQVVLPDGRAYNNGDTPILTDEQYYSIDTSLIGTLITAPTEVAILTKV